MRERNAQAFRSLLAVLTLVAASLSIISAASSPRRHVSHSAIVVRATPTPVLASIEGRP